MGAIKLDLYTNSQFNIQSDYLLARPCCEFVEFAANYVDRYKSRKDKNGSYINAVKHFISFQGSINTRFKTNEVGCDILEEFGEYLINEKHLKINTTKGIFQKIKYILKKADQNCWAVDNSFYDAKPKREKTFAVALDERDISRIYYYEGLNKREEVIRDWFVLACQTGLRYSDFIRLTKDHFKDNIIEIKMQKTKEIARIPIDIYVKEIFAKYNNEMPTAKSHQHFNYAIKRICKKIGFTQEITHEVEENGKVVPIKIPLYKLIASHTGRRSFVTIRFEKGWSIDDIANCTAHQSIICLMGYNKRDRRRMAQKMAA